MFSWFIFFIGSTWSKGRSRSHRDHRLQWQPPRSLAGKWLLPILTQTGTPLRPRVWANITFHPPLLSEGSTSQNTLLPHLLNSAPSPWPSVPSLFPSVFQSFLLFSFCLQIYLALSGWTYIGFANLRLLSWKVNLAKPLRALWLWSWSCLGSDLLLTKCMS